MGMSRIIHVSSGLPRLHSHPNQNVNRAANCMLRAEPEPTGVVLLTARICPNVGDERFTVGLPSSTRLNTLNASMRNCTLFFSVILTLLAIAVSTWNKPGARMRALPAVPQVPLAGIEKAAGLTQLVIVCPPVGITDKPGTRFGRWPALLPSGMSVVLRETVTVRGSPVRAEATPLRIQLRRNTE